MSIAIYKVKRGLKKTILSGLRGLAWASYWQARITKATYRWTHAHLLPVRSIKVVMAETECIVPVRIVRTVPIAVKYRQTRGLTVRVRVAS